MQSKFVVRRALRHAPCLLLIASAAAPAFAQYTFPPGSTQPIQNLLNGPLLPVGTTITLTVGTYTGSLDYNGQPVTIQGAGQSQTIIDGAGLATRVIRFANGEGHTSILRNLGVWNGPAGGIECDGAGPRIENCTIENNTASPAGGVLVRAPSPSGNSLEMINCKLNRNHGGGQGGGVAILSSATGSNAALFQECEFDTNDAGSLGGGAYMFGRMAPTFERCLFHDNTAVDVGGGAYWRECAAPTFVDCAFERNVAYNGGGVGYFLPGSSVLRHCTFSANEAVRVSPLTGFGGAIWGSSTPPPASQGGCDSAPAFRNCLIWENLAAEAAGAYLINASPLLTFCTFSLNVASVSVGGILAADVTGQGTCAGIDIRNSILWGNSGTVSGQPLWSKELWAETCAPLVTSCDIEGSTTPSANWITNNLQDSDPRFVKGYACKTSPVGDAFLVQSPLQPPPFSRCVNSSLAQASGTIIAGRSTRTDGGADAGRADLGFHYPSICP